MQKISDSFTSYGNELQANFSDWSVTIKPVFVGNGYLLRWTVTFSRRDSYAQPIYCKTLESAFELVNEYKDQHQYDKLLNQLLSDMDIKLEDDYLGPLIYKKEDYNE